MERISTCSPCACVREQLCVCDILSQGTPVAICFWGAGSQCANPALWNLPAWALFSALLPREHQEGKKTLQGCHLLKHIFPSLFISLLLCYKIRVLSRIFKIADSLGHMFLTGLLLPRVLRPQQGRYSEGFPNPIHQGWLYLEGPRIWTLLSSDLKNIEKMSVVLLTPVFPWAWLGVHKDGNFYIYIYIYIHAYVYVYGFLISFCKSALKCVGKGMYFVLLEINTSEICLFDFS